MRFSLKSISLIVCCLCVARTASARDCGVMLRSMSYFRGTIRSVKPLGETDVENDVDVDPRFAVVVEVESVKSGVAAPKAGETLLFAVHSPSHTFGAGKLIGRLVDLEAERMDCNGAFRRFIRLERHWPSPVVETFDGRLEVGHIYRSRARWNGRDLELPKTLELPMHHDGGVNFMNAESFLTEPETVREIVFEVVALHISMAGEGSWLSMYDAKITSARR